MQVAGNYLALTFALVHQPALHFDFSFCHDPLVFKATEGFADVGCRLAFNAKGTPPPRESFAVRALKILTDEVYLLR